MMKAMTRTGLAVMAAAMMMGTCVPCFAMTVSSSKVNCSSDFSYDDDGNATRTTKVEVTEDGETRSFEYKELIDAKTGDVTLQEVPLLIDNDSDTDIKEFYMVPSSQPDWGDEMFFGEGLAKDKENADYTISVDEAGSPFDFKIVTADGQEHYFEDIDLKDIPRDQALISLEGNAKEGYTLFNTTNQLDLG